MKSKFKSLISEEADSKYHMKTNRKVRMVQRDYRIINMLPWFGWSGFIIPRFWDNNSQSDRHSSTRGLDINRVKKNLQSDPEYVSESLGRTGIKFFYFN